MDTIDDDVTDGEPVVSADAQAGTPPEPRWWTPLLDDSLRSLWIHAGLLLVVLLAFIPIIDNGHILMPDEGVYLAQAEALSEGSWSSERPAIDVDPTGVFAPVTDGGVIGDRVVHYYKHPLYPIMLVPAFVAGGQTGAMVLSVLGTWCAALVGAFIARRIRPSYGLWALWLLGVASPLFFDAYIVLGHSVGAAFAGLAFLGVSRSVDGGRLVHLTYALPAAALVVAIRGEGLIFAAALGGAVGLMAIGWPPLKRVDWRAALIGTAVLATAAVAFFLDRTAAAAVIGTHSTGTPLGRLSSSSADPLAGAWISLGRPFISNWSTVSVYLPLTVMGILLGAIALRLMPRRTALPVVALVAAAFASIGLLVDPPGMVTGLLAAFPLLGAGLIWLRWRDFAESVVARAALVGGLAASGILLTNYRVGGAIEWGGRFFHILLPLLVPLVVVGLDNARNRLSQSEALVAALALGTICISIAGGALNAQTEYRGAVADSVDGTLAEADRLGDPLIVITKTGYDGSARLFWDTDHEVLSNYGLSNLHVALRAAAGADRDEVLISTNLGPTLFALQLQQPLEDLGWKIEAISTSPRQQATLVLVTPTEE